MSINDPRGRELYREMGDTTLTNTFDTSNGGQHQVCFQNTERDQVKVDVRIKTGGFQGEEDSITKKHLKPVEV